MQNKHSLFKRSTLIILSLLVYSFSSAAEKAPFSFSEEVIYLSKEKNPMIDFLKTDFFIGAVSRVGVPDENEKNLDVYAFPDMKIKKITTDICLELAEKVFGPLKEIHLKNTGQDIFRSPRNGDICELVMRDEAKGAQFKERRFYAFISDEKAYGLVGRFSKEPRIKDVEDLRKFIKGLRRNL